MNLHTGRGGKATTEAPSSSAGREALEKPPGVPDCLWPLFAPHSGLGSFAFQ